MLYEKDKYTISIWDVILNAMFPFVFVLPIYMTFYTTVTTTSFRVSEPSEINTEHTSNPKYTEIVINNKSIFIAGKKVTSIDELDTFLRQELPGVKLSLSSETTASEIEPVVDKIVKYGIKNVEFKFAH